MGLTGNRILAIVIVLIFFMSAIFWAFSVMGDLFAGQGGDAAALFIPGAIGFGFVALVVRQLWNCEAPVALPFVQ